MPVLHGTQVEESARGVSDYITDPRAAQFVDVDGSLSKAYASVIKLPPPIPAWDVYFVFGPDVHWPEGQGSNHPPAPTYWMHQLGRAAPPELRLDGEQFGRYVGGMLHKMGK